MFLQEEERSIVSSRLDVIEIIKPVLTLEDSLFTTIHGILHDNSAANARRSIH
jgi:hypothetical protein